MVKWLSLLVIEPVTGSATTRHQTRDQLTCRRRARLLVERAAEHCEATEQQAAGSVGSGKQKNNSTDYVEGAAIVSVGTYVSSFLVNVCNMCILVSFVGCFCVGSTASAWAGYKFKASELAVRRE